MNLTTLLKSTSSAKVNQYTPSSIFNAIKVEHHQTATCVNYIIELVEQLDSFINASPRGIPLLRRAAHEYSRRSATKDETSSATSGLFATFLSKIPTMINFHERESVSFFTKRFEYIFKGVGSIMSAMLLTEDSVLKRQSLSPADGEIEVGALFDAAVKERLQKETLILPVRKCICSTKVFKNPCVLRHDSPTIQTTPVKTCDGLYSIHHANGKYLKTIIQFGCSDDYNERQIFVYYHTDPAKTGIQNLTLVLDTKLSSTLKKFSLGLTCVNLYKSLLRSSPELIPIMQGFPSLDIHFFNGFREQLMTLLAGATTPSLELSASIGNFISTWMIDTQIFKGSGDRIQYLMQPYFTSLLQNELFQTGVLDRSRLDTLNCPEILRFSDRMYETVKGCVEGLREHYVSRRPVLPIEKDGVIVLGCGAVVDSVELFNHPCFVVNLAKGRDNNVVLPLWNPELKKPYSFTFSDNPKDKNAPNRAFCRCCSREYPNLQFSLLCGIRCTLLREVFLNNQDTVVTLDQRALGTSVLKTVNMIQAFINDDVNSQIEINYSHLISGVLASEVPYCKSRSYHAGARVSIQTLNLRGEFVE